MPFTTAKFQEVGETEIFDNLMALIHRDMKLALDYFWAADNLPDFALMTDGEVDHFVYPLLVLGVERMTSAENDSGFYLDQDLRIGAGMVVQDTSSLKNVRKKARKYVRAFKAVLRSAPPHEFLPDANEVLDYTVDIDHRYLRHATKETAFIQPVELEIKIRFGET